MNTEIDISSVTLYTDRLILRPWRVTDLDDFYEYASVDGVGQMAGWKPHEDKNESRKILDSFIEHKKTFALEYQGKVIGSLGIEKYNEERYPEYKEKKCREIHRDVHFGNFLFSEGNLSGYIDFDLSQRNIRIFDICYFLTGLLAEETEEAFTKKEWTENVRAAIEGYENITRLSAEEEDAIPCVMECIEILFAAYFIGIGDFKHAEDAWEVFLFIQDCKEDI